MIKVLIVEDEYLVRVGLKSMIDWESEGFEVIGDASNGIEAYDLYQKYKPDVVMTDIAMPKMSGLELIQLIRADNQVIKFIIISCHADFGYAQKAMAYGVSHYIEKSSMEPEQLIEILNSLKKDIHIQQETTPTIKNREEVLLEVITSTVLSWEEKVKLLEAKHVSLNHQHYAMMVMKVDFSHSVDYDKNVFYTVAEEMLTEALTGFIVEIKEGLLFGLFAYTPNKYDGLAMCQQYIARFTETLNQLKQISFQTIIHPHFTSLSETNLHYEQLKRLESYLVFYAPGTTIIDETMVTRVDENYLSNMNVEALYKMTLNGEDKAIREHLCHVFDALFQGKHSLVNLYGHCNQLIATINKVMNYYADYFSQIYDVYYIEYDAIRQIRHIEDIRQFFYDKYLEVSSYCRKVRFYDGDHKVIHQVITYLINHHQASLTLEVIANQHQLSRVYLSQLIKKETGDNFVNILNRVRVEKAKLLLETGHYKVYEVADQVGFDGQSSYFIKVFKHITGKTPTDYQNGL